MGTPLKYLTKGVTAVAVVTMRNRKQKPREDANQIAHATLQAIIDGGEIPMMPDGKNPLAVALGRMGGLKGGKARAESMTAKQRSDSAKKAATARWKNKIG